MTEIPRSRGEYITKRYVSDEIDKLKGYALIIEEERWLEERKKKCNQAITRESRRFLFFETIRLIQRWE